MDKLSLTEILQTRELTDAIVESFLLKTMAEERKEAEEQVDDPEFSAFWLELMESSLQTHYRRGVERIYRYAESPIEKVFFNSLLLAFLKADPLNFIIVEPEQDALAAIARDRLYANEMPEIDQAFRDKHGGHKGDGFHRYLDLVLESGRMNQEEHDFLWEHYLALHMIGFADAFHLIMQANLPEIKVDGHAIRTDALIYVPSKPSLNIIVECDGFQFHADKKSFIRDRKRDRVLQKHGFRIWRVAGSEIHKDPVDVSSELYHYLQGQGIDESGLPLLLAD